MKIRFLIILLWLSSGHIFAQNPNPFEGLSISQLAQQLEKSDNLVDSFLIYSKMGANLFQYTPQDSMILFYFQSALNLAKRQGDSEDIVNAYSRFAKVSMRQGRTDSDLTLKYLKEGLRIAKQNEKNNPRELAIIYRDFHLLSYYEADYQKMLEYGELTIAVLKNTEEDDLLASAYMDVGNAYYYLGDYQKSLANYISAAKLYEGGKSSVYQVYGNISDVYLLLNQLDNAEESLQSFLKASINDGDKKSIAAINYKLSKVAQLHGDYEAGLNYGMQSIKANNGQFPSIMIYGYIQVYSALTHLKRFSEALEYAFLAKETLKTNQDVGQVGEVEYSIGKIYLEMGNFEEAQKHFSRSAEIAEERKYLHLQMRSVFDKSKSHKAQGNYKDAFSNLETYVALKDSLFNTEKSQQARELQTKYETERKELENANLKETNELIQSQNKKYLIGGAVLGGLLLLLGLFFVQLQRIKNQLAKQNKMVAQKNNELTELDQIKSRFFANVSHELRTPLTLILGPLSRMLKSKNIDNKEFTMLKIMEQNGGNLLKLINEILDLTKLEANKLELKEKPTVLYLFVQRLLASFETHAQKKSINLIFEYKADTNLQVNIDPNKLEKIINNLISNACKFTPPNGEIMLKVSDLGSRLQFKISDTGRGIDKADLPHIFDRFYQSKLPGGQAEGGTGIGLALVNEFVKLFGGTIAVESELNKGSVFTIQFPKKQVLKALENGDALAIHQLSNGNTIEAKEEAEPLLSIQPLLSANNPNKKSTILIVEDNLQLSNYIQLVLSDFYHTPTAENGKVALDWLNSLEENNALPDLIISDVMMPIMDGVQFLTKLKEHNKFNTIPVVMLTAKAALEDKILALRIGVDDYMVKPFVEEELLARIENLLRNAKARVQYLEEQDDDETLVPATSEGEPTKELQEKNKVISQQDLQWLKELEEKVLASYSDFDFNLDRLSELIFLSPRQTRRRLKQLTGLGFSQYLKEVRFTESRRLLENGEVNSIKQLAYEIGMRDVKYFSQQFKAHYGKSPSAYLEK